MASPRKREPLALSAALSAGLALSIDALCVVDRLVSSADLMTNCPRPRLNRLRGLFDIRDDVEDRLARSRCQRYRPEIETLVAQIELQRGATR